MSNRFPGFDASGQQGIDPDTGKYSGAFSLGPNCPLLTAFRLGTVDPPFYLQLGGNPSLYLVDMYDPNTYTGFPTGPQEQAELQDAKLVVAPALTDNPDLLAQERANPQTNNAMIQVGWVNDQDDIDSMVAEFLSGSGQWTQRTLSFPQGIQRRRQRTQ